MERRKLIKIGLYLAAGATSLVLLYGCLSWVGARYVRSELTERASAYGRTAEVGEVSVFWPGTVSVKSLKLLHPNGENARFDEIEVGYRPWSLLWGELQVTKVSIKGGQITLTQTADGRDNFTDLLNRSNNKPQGGSSSGGGRFSDALLEVSGLSLVASVDTATQKVRARIEDISLKLPASGAGTLVLESPSLLEEGKAPALRAGSVQIRLQRDQKQVSLLGASLIEPEMTLRRARHLGLPVDGFLSLVKKQSKESAPSPTPVSVTGIGRAEGLLLQVLRTASSWEALDATLHVEDPSTGASLTLRDVGFRMSTVRASSEDDNNLLLQFYASGGAPGKEAGWSAEGSYDLIKRSFTAALQTSRLSLQNFSPYLEGGQVVDPGNAAIDLSLEVSLLVDKSLFVGGSFAVSGLTVQHPKIANKPVRDVSFSLEGEVSYDLQTKVLEILKGKILRDKAQVELSLLISPVENGTRYAGKAKMPKTKCGELFASVPPDLIPVLEGFELGGTFDFDLVFELDTRKPKEMKLDGPLDLNRCKVLVSGPNVRVPMEELKNGSFSQHVEEADGKVYDFVVGEDSADWTPQEEISPYLWNGILTTEDGAFFSHKGFNTKQVLRSIVENIIAEDFKRGASTITMQFVKNVLLSREKTVSRKLQEMVLTWWVEQNIPKERILTLYFNLIEFGPGIFGIRDAAEHYFECLPSELNPWQAAFLLSIVPSPKKYHAMYFEKKEKEVSRSGTEKVRRILDHMYSKGRLTEAEYKEARAATIVFGRTEPASQPASQPSDGSLDNEF